MSHKNNKCKISALTWNEKFEITDGLYSVSYIPDCLKYIIEENETATVNPLTETLVNKIENLNYVKHQNRILHRNLNTWKDETT